jgi:hypothetical protein
VNSHAQKFIEAEATKELALFACTSGVPFNAFRNPHFIKYSKILNQLYKVPTPYTLKGPELDNADEEINAWKDAVIASSLVCLTSDGYTNVKLVNLINFEVLTKHGPVHVDTVQRTSADVLKDADYIASLIIEVVQKLGGVKKVVGFVSDNEKTMKAVWRILEERLDHFLTSPCVVLLCKFSFLLLLVLLLQRHQPNPKSCSLLSQSFLSSVVVSGEEISQSKIGTKRTRISLHYKVWLKLHHAGQGH